MSPGYSGQLPTVQTAARKLEFNLPTGAYVQELKTIFCPVIPPAEHAQVGLFLIELHFGVWGQGGGEGSEGIC